MQQKQFQTVYQALNPAQKEAVDTIDGPVMVVAGPGTGKTQVLATRIANILKKTDTDPKSILALTFTESAARNMRERVVSLIGQTGYRVRIETFHSFCKTVIQDYPEYFPFATDAEVISELKQYQLVENLLVTGKFEKLKPVKAKSYYVKPIIRAISDLKREGVGPKKLLKLINQEFQDIKSIKSKQKQAKLKKQKEKNLELYELYTQYEAHLRNTGQYDFNDMIMMVLEAFEKHPDLLLDYQEELLYFLVDEYQDTNSAQNQVVSLLASYWKDKANVFVVGDPQQSIFRFQGASLANLSWFLEKYPLAKVINLDIGYRCPQLIYNAAFDLVRSSEKKTKQNSPFELLKLDQPLKSIKKQPSKGSLELYEASSQLTEYIYLAKKIKKLLNTGVAPESIAVLYRNNVESLSLMEVFDKWSINYDVVGGGNVLDIEEIRQLIQFLRTIYLYREGEKYVDLFEVMGYDWISVENQLALKLARLAHKRKKSLVELIEEAEEEGSVGSGMLKVGSLELESVREFLRLLQELAEIDWRQPFVKFFQEVIEKSGYLDWILKQTNKHELIVALNSLFREIKALNYADHDLKLGEFLKSVELMNQYHLSIRVDDLNIKTGAVTLSTVHKAKGLEWDYVFLVGLVDGKWGNKRNTSSGIKLPSQILAVNLPEEDKNAEERRLFYVGLTRAKNKVYLSYPQTEVTQGSVKEYLPSEFLLSLKKAGHLQLIDYQVKDEVIDDLKKILLPPPEKLTAKANERAFFKYLVDTFALSSTALNKYLKSPRDFALETLLKVPKAKDANLGYGTAVHTALEKVNRFLIKNGSLPPLEFVLSEFEAKLKDQLMSEEDYALWLKKGHQSLTTYYQARLEQSQTVPLQAEKGFYSVYLDDIRLTGKLDRVEWLDASKKWVRVVDYKTGRPRSENEIEAKTKSSRKYLSPRELELPESLRGSYKRQLLFYKVLTDLDPSFPYIAKQGTFDFVEPNDNGKLAKLRTFEFDDEEVEQMKQLIKTVMGEIRELKFLEELG